ncbi:amidohydrolase family protein [Streptomyces sp. NPDC002588]|uniref:amidohydrolase family protein n=1 Tax=Streptomyces sp. NPDC002588 TaxID=3154419 RepID=UPI00331C7B9F
MGGILAASASASAFDTGNLSEPLPCWSRSTRKSRSTGCVGSTTTPRPSETATSHGARTCTTVSRSRTDSPSRASAASTDTAPTRLANARPVKRMPEPGIPVGAGTDGTRLSNCNPWISLRWMVTGRTVGGMPVLGKAGRLGRMEALRHCTVGGAWLTGEENEKGSLERGSSADLAVLSADYFIVPEGEIAHLVSVLTVPGDRIVHAWGSTSASTRHESR